MIHIIDPRTQSPMPDLVVWPNPFNGHKGEVRRQRYLADRHLHCADLVAIREQTGLYRVVKATKVPLPQRPVRLKTLQRYVEKTLEAHSA